MFTYTFITKSGATFAITPTEDNITMTMVAARDEKHPDPHAQAITFDEPPTVGEMFFFTPGSEKEAGHRLHKGHTSVIQSIHVDHSLYGPVETNVWGDTAADLLAHCDENNNPDPEPMAVALTEVPQPTAAFGRVAVIGNGLVTPFWFRQKLGDTPNHVLTASTYPIAS